MQVRSIAPTDGPNPDFKRHLPTDRQTNWPIRDFPIGTILTGPDVYKLCLVQLPKHVPHDDEAKAAVAARLKTRPEAPVEITLPEEPPAASSEPTIPGTGQPPEPPSEPSSDPTIPADGDERPVRTRPPRANK